MTPVASKSLDPKALAAMTAAEFGSLWVSAKGGGDDALRELTEFARAVLGEKTTPRTAKDADLAEMHRLLAKFLQDETGESIPPLPLLKKTTTWGPFREGTAALLDYIRAEIKPTRKADELWLARYLIGLMAKDIRQCRPKDGREIPVCLRTLCHRMIKVAVCVERHFPEYRRRGWLPMLLRARG